MALFYVKLENLCQPTLFLFSFSYKSSDFTPGQYALIAKLLLVRRCFLLQRIKEKPQIYHCGTKNYRFTQLKSGKF